MKWGLVKSGWGLLLPMSIFPKNEKFYKILIILYMTYHFQYGKSKFQLLWKKITISMTLTSNLP